MKDTMKSKNGVLIQNVLWSLLGGLILWMALRSYLDLPYTDNEGALVLFGRELAHGARLYVDIWDHKPPLLFEISWWLQLFFPLSEIRLHLFVLGIHAVNAFLVFQLAKRLGFSRSGAWASALVYLSLLFPPLFQPWAAEADLLMQPFLLGSFWAALSPRSGIIFLSGALWTAAFMTKQSALFFLPVYLMAGAFADIPKILKWMTGVLLFGAIMLGPFTLDHRWGDFSSALIGFNQYYIEKGWLFFFATKAFRHFLVQWAQMAAMTYGLAFLGMGLGILGKGSKVIHERTFYILFAWFLGVVISCGVSGYFFTYYYIVLLPPLALGLGRAWMKWRETHRWDLTICFSLLFAGVLAVFFNFHGIKDHIFSYGQYPVPRYFADKAMGERIAREAKPGDELLAWSDDPQLYVYSGLKPFIKTPFINHLSGMPYEAWKLYKDFSLSPPEFCVVSRMSQVLPPPAWLRIGLRKRYVMEKSIGDLDLYQLR